MALDLQTLVDMAGRIALVFVVAYACIVIVFALVEPWLVYPAPRVSPHQLALMAARSGATELDLTASDGTRLYGWRLPGDPTAPHSDLLVLFFSGNGSSVALETGHYAHFGSVAGEVLHVNYRGYPGSGGRSSEQGLIRDAEAAWAEARRTHESGDILIAAKSLGGGPAIALARSLSDAGTPPRGLYLESTFTSAEGVARDAYPWLPTRLFMRSRWHSDDRAPGVGCLALVAHGDRDGVIDVHHGRDLHRLLPRSTYIEVRGGQHNDVLLDDLEVRAALTALAGASTGSPG